MMMRALVVRQPVETPPAETQPEKRRSGPTQCIETPLFVHLQRPMVWPKGVEQSLHYHVHRLPVRP